MGNTSSNEPIWHSTCYDLPLSEENLTHIKTRQDPLLGDIQELVHNSNNQSILKKEVLLLNDQSQLTEDALHKIKQRVHLTNENLLKIYGFELKLSTEETSKIGIFFEPFTSSAGVQFGVRQQDKYPFDEEELYTTILTVVQTLAYLQSHKLSHGHLSPHAILMSQDGDIKLLDHSLIQRENSAYLASLHGAQIPYLAPELVTLLKDKAPVTGDINQFKADVFSLGLTFLYGALLEEPNDCYDWENHTFVESALTERIRQVQTKYPGRFSNILTQILKVDPAERPDPLTLMSKLEYYENSQLSKGSINYASGSYTSHQYTFVDPRVQEIIREAKEKNWIKSTAHSSTVHSNNSALYYNQQYTDTIKNKALANSDSRYHSPFLERYNEYLSKSNFINKNVSGTQESEIRDIDTSKLIFNRPEVNELIENVVGLKKSGVISHREWSAPLLKSEYAESYLKRSHLSDEKISGLSSRYGNGVDVTSFESPEKKSYSQLVRESDGYSWGSGLKNSNEAPTNIILGKSGRKMQTKEEIIKELRSKYGSQKSHLEGKESEEKSSKVQEIQESKTVKQQ